MDFDRRLGEHLRRVRQQKGLSLLDVEAASGKEFKASVLGAYERGERAISVRRLARLAEIYRVPLRALLPEEPAPSAPVPGGVVVDLARLGQVEAPEARTLRRFVHSLQAVRGDWGGRVMTIRGDDLRALAAALERTPEELVRRLGELGLVPGGGGEAGGVPPAGGSTWGQGGAR